MSFFVGPLIPLFWTPGDVCPGFQSQTPADLLMASMTARHVPYMHQQRLDAGVQMGDLRFRAQTLYPLGYRAGVVSFTDPPVLTWHQPIYFSYLAVVIGTLP